jgi:hypothetical protein
MRRKLRKAFLICVFVLPLAGFIFFGSNQQDDTNSLPEWRSSATADTSFSYKANLLGFVFLCCKSSDPFDRKGGDYVLLK